MKRKEKSDDRRPLSSADGVHKKGQTPDSDVKIARRVVHDARVIGGTYEAWERDPGYGESAAKLTI